MTDSVKSRLAWGAFALVILCTEVLIATVWAKVPFVRADLGDYLVVILLYATARSVRPFPPRALAASILAFSFLVEITQHFHLADRLGFARGSLASIVLGTSFQVSDLFMYLAGCLTAWFLDERIVKRGSALSA